MTSRKNRYFDREDQFRSIILSNDIDNESVEEVIQFILDANEYDDEQDSVSKDFERKPIKLVVNSFGGVIYDGFALIGVIKTSRTPIHTYCYGYAMSMGLKSLNERLWQLTKSEAARKLILNAPSSDFLKLATSFQTSQSGATLLKWIRAAA